MRIPLPTYDEILQLPARLEGPVPPEFIDTNSHMNIVRYLELGGKALRQRCYDEFGMSGYETRGLSRFVLEHHLTYQAEVLEAEIVSVHVRLIAHSDKALHAVSLIVNRTRQLLACTVESTLLNIDMSARKSSPFPDDVALLLGAALKTDDLDWQAPLCGAMGVSRR